MWVFVVRLFYKAIQKNLNYLITINILISLDKIFVTHLIYFKLKISIRHV